ncbi:MAG TPA: fumarylacetoacetate hydrolase family protein [Pirellulales bacterium]|jgi:2-keto-4-pentenoate hydratase/2-oxohepta-3-ene-1,7-dioic acid hydratase in catechol pathway|nr:fumarylacetoacetate hydrolase family protein [Pirellulales bacterium]
MRLCRFRYQDQVHVGVYDEKSVTSLTIAAGTHFLFTSQVAELPPTDSLTDYLPPDRPGWPAVQKLVEWLQGESRLPAGVSIPTERVELLVPIPRPNKLFLLAGNYAEHIREHGGSTAERAETFPYVFMKPPTTTLTDPGSPVRIPTVSPKHIDWELELAVVIGRRTRHIAEADALSAVAGYTIVNDISDRKFRPNPGRKQREKDTFFDWMHGKWHDSFCPCGPCVTTADEVPDPQQLKMQLRLNGAVRQDASTALQIFPVAAIVAFISDLVTLEPGDIISTGTPSGVGSASGTFLKPGDMLEASIERIGTLRTPIESE